MKVGIIGCGFVGEAVRNSLLHTTELVIVDPKDDNNPSIEEMVNMDVNIVFICVPTPDVPNRGIDASIVIDVILDLDKFGFAGTAVLKSTVTPAIIKNLLYVFDKNNFGFVYNPEFLTQVNAKLDFLKPDMQVIGSFFESDARILEYFYATHTMVDKSPVFITDPFTASLVKYTLNCWMATKVSFFNEINAIFDMISTDQKTTWEQFIDIIGTDHRVGRTHMQVPGPDGQYGYGGACFPKDMNAFRKFADKIGVETKVINAAIEVNDIYRNRRV
jgi:UDPglucose 6-dehydrogenase